MGFECNSATPNTLNTSEHSADAHPRRITVRCSVYAVEPRLAGQLSERKRQGKTTRFPASGRTAQKQERRNSTTRDDTKHALERLRPFWRVEVLPLPLFRFRLRNRQIRKRIHDTACSSGPSLARDLATSSYRRSRSHFASWTARNLLTGLQLPASCFRRFALYAQASRNRSTTPFTHPFAGTSRNSAVIR